MSSMASSTPVKRSKTPSISSMTSNSSKKTEVKKRGRPKSSNTSLNSSTPVQNGKAKEKEKDKKTPSRIVPKRKSSSQIGKFLKIQKFKTRNMTFTDAINHKNVMPYRDCSVQYFFES